MSLLKKRLNFAPKWTEEVDQWVNAVAFQNAWRVAPDMDADDLIQEARILFMRCEDRYWPEQANNSRHFCALFRTAFVNKINNLALKHSRYRRTMDASAEFVQPNPYEGLAELEVKDLLEAPKPDALDRLVLHLVNGECQSRKTWRNKDNRRHESMPQFLGRVSGAPRSRIIGMVRDWIDTGTCKRVTVNA